MLDMQKRFEEKLEALREENGEIKAWLYDKRDDLEKEKSPKKKEATARVKKTKIKVLSGHTRRLKSRRRTKRARFLIQQALTQDLRR